MSEPKWSWRDNPDYRGLIELYDDAGRMLAWISERPPYCDRGHFQANVECVPNLDSQDGWPRYYMHLDVAQRETTDFLRWRLLRERTPPREAEVRRALLMGLQIWDEYLSQIGRCVSQDYARLNEFPLLCTKLGVELHPKEITK